MCYTCRAYIIINPKQTNKSKNSKTNKIQVSNINSKWWLEWNCFSPYDCCIAAAKHSWCLACLFFSSSSLLIFIYFWLYQAFVVHLGFSLDMVQACLYHGMWNLSSLTRGQTHVPCIGRHILSHWTASGWPSPAFPILYMIQFFHNVTYQVTTQMKWHMLILHWVFFFLRLSFKWKHTWKNFHRERSHPRECTHGFHFQQHAVTDGLIC